MIIVGDIHLDKRFPFTNKKTANRWRALQDATLERVVSLTKDDEQWIQVGDLFDNFMVTAEQFIRAQILVSKHCVALLAGNHDRSNDTDKVSAVNLLTKAVSEVSEITEDAHHYVLVPHQLTQDAFNAALVDAESRIRLGRINVLLLHCNFSDREGVITENYLSSARLKELESKFAFIIGGHEHNGRSTGPRSLLIGSLLPMNFGEMGPKYVMGIDTTDTNMHLIWDDKEHYRKWSYEEFLEQPITNDLQFIEVNGAASVTDTLLVAKKVAAWYNTSESIIAIKPDLTRVETTSTAEDAPNARQVSWVDFLTNQMTEDERVLFEELMNAA